MVTQMKRRNRIAGMLIAGICLVGGCLPIPASAVQTVETMHIAEMRATNDFEATIPAKSTKTLKTALPLASGESVYIDLSYTPGGASIDVGLISPDGVFSYMPTYGGHVSLEIPVNKAGEYKFAIRNNSSETITVSGQIRY